MKQVLTFVAVFLFGVSSLGQNNAALIKLGKAYNNYMFANTPEKKYLKKFVKVYPSSLQQEAEFIKETISTKNQLLKKEFLVIPDQAVLKNIYIIQEVNLLLSEESEMTADELVSQLEKTAIPRYELVDNYYEMLFTGVGNKNQPFDFSKSDFNLEGLGLGDEVEQGIFFLKCMNLCGRSIWGYMNIPKPPNTADAWSLIKKYPKFNGEVYYKFTDLYFKDFKMVIVEEEGMQSYKSYYLNKYYETLLSHLICLHEEGGTEADIKNLLLGSILKDHKLYQYTQYKEVLESIFQTKEQD